jgi:hypothetical protein
MTDQLFTGSYPSDALTEAKQLRAENERLRAALLAIVETTDGLPGTFIQECRQIARTALKHSTAPHTATHSAKSPR